MVALRLAISRDRGDRNSAVKAKRGATSVRSNIHPNIPSRIAWNSLLVGKRDRAPKLLRGQLGRRL